MPHIILTGAPDLTAAQKAFQPFRGDANDWIIKIQHCFVSETGATLIFDCTAVRSGFSQDFYIRAELKERGLTVRVDPYMRIERNEGVQRAIVAISKFLQGQLPELLFSKSNIPDTILAMGELS